MLTLYRLLLLLCPFQFYKQVLIAPLSDLHLQYGVPTMVVRLFCSGDICAQKPKSVNFTDPSRPRRMLSDLMSLLVRTRLRMGIQSDTGPPLPVDHMVVVQKLKRL